MAIVLRHRTADVALEKYFLAHGLAFCPEGREKIDLTKKTALGHHNQLGKNKIVEMGFESTKMPSFCEQEFLIGYGDFVLSINPRRHMNDDPKQQARTQLAKCLGLMVLADSGVSPHRRDPILNCLVHLVGSREDIVRMPALEDTYSLILVQSPILAVQELLRWITRRLILKNRDLRRALLCLSMHWNTFERSVEALGEELLLPTEKLCPASNCNRPLRFADFQITEPAVRPLTCDCVVGRRCLFKHLMFQSTQDRPIWTCPACNTEIANLARTLPVPMQSLIHITKYAPLPHELEQYEPGVARLFAEKSPMTEYWLGYMDTAVGHAWVRPGLEPPTDPTRRIQGRVIARCIPRDTGEQVASSSNSSPYPLHVQQQRQ
jgi:hypothetical protein